MPRIKGNISLSANTSFDADNKLVARDRLNAILRTAFAAPRWQDVVIDIKLDEIGSLDDPDDIM